MSNSEYQTCPTCGARTRQYKHFLMRPMIDALARLALAGGAANISRIGLTHSQICNFQKLRYWKLTEKTGLEGYWNVTDVGYAFLQGKASVRRAVWTFRASVVRYEGDTVYVYDYLDSEFMGRLDYVLNRSGLTLDDENLTMFD